MISFYKYQGAGNDFIMIDNRNDLISKDKEKMAIKLCERRFGLGSDGLIFIEADKDVDFNMNFFNPDGSQSFCGNGSRCAVKFAKYLNAFEGDKTDFKAIDGIHSAELIDGNVKVSIQNVLSYDKYEDDYYMHTGSPHYMKFYNNVDEEDLILISREIRYSEKFKPGGTNVNFIQKVNNYTIKIRTYERGVENETYACGTGATACALTQAIVEEIPRGNIKVKAKGGDLSVDFVQDSSGFSDVWLEGPAEFVYKGTC